MKRAFGLLFVALALALACSACGSDYSETDITAIVGSFSGASTNSADVINKSHITLTEGHILKAHIEVLDDDNKQMSVRLKSDDPSTLEVDYVINPNDFAFVALQPGSTQIEIIADDVRRLTINATVVPLPSPE